MESRRDSATLWGVRYLDTNSRQPEDTLYAWLTQQLREGMFFACQTGFFAKSGVVLIADELRALLERGGEMHIVIGGNQGAVTRPDLEALLDIIGPFGDSHSITMALFPNVLFHPKTYYIEDRFGVRHVYIGSANFTADGLTRHIEAGLCFDSQTDPGAPFDAVRDAIAAWRTPNNPNTIQVERENLEQLESDGILGTVAARTTSNAEGRAAGVHPPGRFPPLPPLLRLSPRLHAAEPPLPSVSSAPNWPTILPAARPSVPLPNYPAYLLFAPYPTAPTVGAEALSGASLKDNAPGLIVRLSKDTARHFSGGTGTANLSIPVATVGTFRFGMFSGKFERPRVEFGLRIRYLAANDSVEVPTSRTNIMAYGFDAGESSHGDLRMVIPAAAKSLSHELQGRGLPLPAPGHVALLEWPTPSAPDFRLSFLESSSALFAAAQQLFASAAAKNQLVGEGACLLPNGLSPDW